MRERRGLRGAALCLTLAALAMSPQMDALHRLPDTWVLRQGEVAALPVSAVVSAALDDGCLAEVGQDDRGMRLTANQVGESELTFRLMGLLPIRKVQLTVEPEKRLIPGGQSVGVALSADGLIVVGNSDLGTTASPARLAGLRSGDVIQRVDGASVSDAEALSACLAGGRTVRLDVLRGDDRLACDVTPAVDSRDGLYKLGAWVRSSTAGVGTLSYCDPDTGRFGALGHAVTDVDTGVELPVGEGALYRNRVVAVKPSRRGLPGELTGDFIADARLAGNVDKNTDFGIFGVAHASVGSSLYPNGIPVAGRDEVHAGKASLLTTVDGEKTCEYTCEIVKVNSGTPSTRALVVRVTDPNLLKQTGGIVQGMSGSPIIQDGKLAGAVTHVMVNDPAMGYGILMEDMLAAGEA